MSDLGRWQSLPTEAAVATRLVSDKAFAEDLEGRQPRLAVAEKISPIFPGSAASLIGKQGGKLVSLLIPNKFTIIFPHPAKVQPTPLPMVLGLFRNPTAQHELEPRHRTQVLPAATGRKGGF